MVAFTRKRELDTPREIYFPPKYINFLIVKPKIAGTHKTRRIAIHPIR